MDLTSRMKPDGSLDWTPPPGNWMVLRMGYSLTGHQNGPAPPRPRAWKWTNSIDSMEDYLNNYVKTYSETVGPANMGKSGITFLLTDSTEVGAQNWTDDMLSEFRQRRGYDARLWLPALTGAIIESPEATDKFLRDFRAHHRRTDRAEPLRRNFCRDASPRNGLLRGSTGISSPLLGR